MWSSIPSMLPLIMDQVARAEARIRQVGGVAKKCNRPRQPLHCTLDKDAGTSPESSLSDKSGRHMMAPADRPAYAEVALPTAIDKTLTYAVPPHLREAAAPGKRVIVPLGPRVVSGYLVRLHERVEIARVKEIQDVLDPLNAPLDNGPGRPGRGPHSLGRGWPKNAIDPDNRCIVP